MMSQNPAIAIFIPEDEYWAKHRIITEEAIQTYHSNLSVSSNLDIEPLSKIEEIADDLGVTRQTVHDWKRKGLIPFERMGGRVYFRKSHVRAALKKIESISLKNR